MIDMLCTTCGRDNRNATHTAAEAFGHLAHPFRDVYAEIHDERNRAHEKHGENSMESASPAAPRRLAILMEEVGEVAREFNEGDIRGDGPDLALLRKELIQTAAMAAAWADVIGAQA